MLDAGGWKVDMWGLFSLSCLCMVALASEFFEPWHASVVESSGAHRCGTRFTSRRRTDGCSSDGRPSVGGHRSDGRLVVARA